MAQRLSERPHGGAQQHDVLQEELAGHPRKRGEPARSGLPARRGQDEAQGGQEHRHRQRAANGRDRGRHRPERDHDRDGDFQGSQKVGEPLDAEDPVEPAPQGLLATRGWIPWASYAVNFTASTRTSP